MHLFTIKFLIQPDKIHQLLDNVIDELQDFVLVEEYQERIKFDVSDESLHAFIKFDHHEDALVLKILDAILRSVEKIKNCACRLTTDSSDVNPILRAYLKKNKLPRCCETESSFNRRLFFFDGKTYFARSLNYADDAVFPFQPDLCIPDESVSRCIRTKLRDARNTLFGQHRLSLNVPDEVAFLIKERPDLLSFAIRRNKREIQEELIENVSWFDNRTMIKTLVVERDYQILNPIESIDGPCDSISERAAWALYQTLQDSEFLKQSRSVKIFENESFETEKRKATKQILLGMKPDLLNAFAKSLILITETDRAGCKKILITSTDSESECAKPKLKKKYKRRTPEEMKTKIMRNNDKRPITSVALIPELDERLTHVEGVASDEDSLGDDEDVDIFGRKPIKKVLRHDNEKDFELLRTAMETTELDDNEKAWEELQPSAAPLAELLCLEDYENL